MFDFDVNAVAAACAAALEAELTKIEKGFYVFDDSEDVETEDESEVIDGVYTVIYMTPDGEVRETVDRYKLLEMERAGILMEVIQW